MLEQRIGPLDISKVINESRIIQTSQSIDEEPKKVFYDKIFDLGDGRTYKGEWLASKPNIKEGVGVMFWPDGTKYEGIFHMDLPHGYGRKIFANGENYEGFFFEGKANGEGTF